MFLQLHTSPVFTVIEHKRSLPSLDEVNVKKTSCFKCTLRLNGEILSRLKVSMKIFDILFQLLQIIQRPWDPFIRDRI